MFCVFDRRFFFWLILVCVVISYNFGVVKFFFEMKIILIDLSCWKW